ncbi:SPOR domain-containing protein [Congregibacter litoralis]|uniref:Cell division protein n=1 Tax=Congregibacter litoralis KT71 TaxID=314285 RepID=A4A8L7_9GAMM|nr:SPOR domain-containing protein [Congregibacter litoralis]EAQ97409.2 Cell division protein [Congregibacter litoralis KT71]
MAKTPNRRSSRGASRHNQTTENHGGLRWYGAGVATGLFLAFLLYLVTLPPEGGAEPELAATARASNPEPEYEFFEVLPNQEITVDVDPADLPKPRSASTGKQFLLQAGSFRQAADADRRRGELLLLGLNPRVEDTQGDTGRWFRVVLGPFESRSAMAKARSLTAQQDIDTLLIQRDRG